MTAKQREALALAAAEGYFAVPRETNLTDLADKLDITRHPPRERLTCDLQFVREVGQVRLARHGEVALGGR